MAGELSGPGDGENVSGGKGGRERTQFKKGADPRRGRKPGQKNKVVDGPPVPVMLGHMRRVLNRAKAYDKGNVQRTFRTMLETRPTEFMKLIREEESKYAEELKAWEAGKLAASAGDVPAGGVGVQEENLRRVLGDLLGKWEG